MNLSATNIEDGVHSPVPPQSQVYVASPLVPPSADTTGRKAVAWYFRLIRAVCSGVHWLFGLISLVVLLSILATIPVVQFLSLGYLLESTGRIIHSKRIRDGFIGIRTAAQVGSIGLGVFLTLLPMRLLSSTWYSSLLLNGDVDETRFLRRLVLGYGILAAGHIAWAVVRGGKLRHFFWPAPLRLYRRLREGGLYNESSHKLLEFFQRLNLRHYFWLGLRGFVGALAWLFVPVSMMGLATLVDDPGFGGLIAFLGGLLLGLVLIYLPFLQARLPMTNRFTSQFDVGAVRRQFQRAPIAYWTALLMTLALAIPLYILKAELVPRQAAWLPSLFFVTFIFPARLAVGWAVSRAEKREQPRFWLFRWMARFGMLPVAMIYALIVYFTQFTSWYGPWSLYEQHAFMLPVPFLGY